MYRYRYYACEKLNGSVSKIPAHEIETIVENDIRNRLCDIKKTAEIFHLDEEYDNYLLNKIIECSPRISMSDLLGATVKKVMLTEMKVIISLDMAGLRKLILNHAKADFPNGEFKSIHELVVPYKKTRASKGSIIIRPEGSKKDIFDLPPQELKKLIQGFAWRDEHFKGLTIRQIAQREKVSDSYVGTQIFRTFEVR